ncbi:MAG: magnesium transporter [Candidatus Woesearchaeota archaeon]|jgi:magnesium transporter
MKKDGIEYADDDKESVWTLMKLRIPSLVLGLILGVALSFVTSRFEEVLAKNISVAFFIPFVVYMADAVGTQTQNIYSRDLKSGKAIFKKYLLKESILGVTLGLIFGLIILPVVILWFHSFNLALAVSISTFGAIASAPLIALIITEILQLDHLDPAVGAGPIATVVQDTASILIYGFIASAILL